MKAKLLLIVFSALSISLYSQKKNCATDYLSKLPKELKLDNSIEQKYLMTTYYEDFDMYGNFKHKTRITGKYTRGLHEGMVKWNDVVISKWNNQNQTYGEGEKQNIMEDFSYIPSDKMMEPQSFPDFPPNSTRLQNLVWDMMGFELFAWEYFDSLELNKEFVAESANWEVDLAGSGTFENKDIRLVWRGISKMNDEICAVIDFTAMNNPLKISNDFIEIKGRSHYWGNIYVSLEDKQIESTLMYEDVIMEIKFPGNDNVKKTNTTRKITLEKLQ